MISFIVIGRNESWRLEKCLASIRKTATTELNVPFELIYVDSQSADNSVSLSKQFADKTFLITGVCNAAIGRNIGAKEAKGEILFFMDGDMELREGVLSSLLTSKGQLTYPFVSGVEYDYLYDHEWNLKRERIRRKFIAGEDVYKPTTGGLFVIEKKLWDDMGGMDNRFFRSQDMDFGLRMSARGKPLLRKGQLWVNHHTMFYAVRNNMLSICKYSALLLRKHFFNKAAQISMLKNNYSVYLLIITLIFMLGVDYIWGLLALMPYLLIICYRAVKTKNRNTSNISYFIAARDRLFKDILFIYYFFTYYPCNPPISYKEV